MNFGCIGKAPNSSQTLLARYEIDAMFRVPDEFIGGPVFWQPSKINEKFGCVLRAACYCFHINLKIYVQSRPNFKIAPFQKITQIIFVLQLYRKFTINNNKHYRYVKHLFFW